MIPTYHKGQRCYGTGYDMMTRIEQLEERLEAATDDAKEAETYAEGLGAALESIMAKLATCEKYRDAYAECDRIGAQAVRELEAKLAKAVAALSELIGHTHDCEKELTEQLHHAEFSGESMSLTNSRTTLAELTGGKDG